MKKFLMTLLLSLTISASCFAAGAAGRFNAEEKEQMVEKKKHP